MRHVEHEGTLGMRYMKCGSTEGTMDVNKAARRALKRLWFEELRAGRHVKHGSTQSMREMRGESMQRTMHVGHKSA